MGRRRCRGSAAGRAARYAGRRLRRAATVRLYPTSRYPLTGRRSEPAAVGAWPPSPSGRRHVVKPSGRPSHCSCRHFVFAVTDASRRNAVWRRGARRRPRPPFRFEGRARRRVLRLGKTPGSVLRPPRCGRLRSTVRLLLPRRVEPPPRGRVVRVGTHHVCAVAQFFFQPPHPRTAARLVARARPVALRAGDDDDRELAVPRGRRDVEPSCNGPRSRLEHRSAAACAIDVAYWPRHVDVTRSERFLRVHDRLPNAVAAVAPRPVDARLEWAPGARGPLRHSSSDGTQVGPITGGCSWRTTSPTSGPRRFAPTTTTRRRVRRCDLDRVPGHPLAVAATEAAPRSNSLGRGGASRAPEPAVDWSAVAFAPDQRVAARDSALGRGTAGVSAAAQYSPVRRSLRLQLRNPSAAPIRPRHGLRHAG